MKDRGKLEPLLSIHGVGNDSVHGSALDHKIIQDGVSRGGAALDRKYTSYILLT